MVYDIIPPLINNVRVSHLCSISNISHDYMKKITVRGREREERERGREKEMHLHERYWTVSCYKYSRTNLVCNRTIKAKKAQKQFLSFCLFSLSNTFQIFILNTFSFLSLSCCRQNMTDCCERRLTSHLSY